MSHIRQVARVHVNGCSHLNPTRQTQLIRRLASLLKPSILIWKPEAFIALAQHPNGTACSAERTLPPSFRLPQSQRSDRLTEFSEKRADRLSPPCSISAPKQD